MKLKCPCKRIKKEVPCFKARETQISVECDEACKDVKKRAAELKEAEERAASEEEKRKQQAELEAFEKRLKGRRKKNKKKDEVEIEETIWQKYKKYIMVPLCGIVLAVAAFYLIQAG